MWKKSKLSLQLPKRRRAPGNILRLQTYHIQHVKDGDNIVAFNEQTSPSSKVRKPQHTSPREMNIKATFIKSPILLKSPIPKAAVKSIKTKSPAVTPRKLKWTSPHPKRVKRTFTKSPMFLKSRSSKVLSTSSPARKRERRLKSNRALFNAEGVNELEILEADVNMNFKDRQSHIKGERVRMNMVSSNN